MEKIKEMIERYKVKAELFLENDIKAYIVDLSGNYYFCEMLFVGDNAILVLNFAGHRKGENTRIYYTDIIKFEEYRKEDEKIQMP